MKLQPKKAKLEKVYNHIDNRKADKITRNDHRDYLKSFHEQGHKCLVCGHWQIEAHHIDPKDNRTIVPLCAYHHRGAYYDENNPFHEKGFYAHRGTRSAEFRLKYPDEYLMTIARGLFYASRNA